MVDQHNKKILVVDDDESTVNILRRMIKHFGVSDVTTSMSPLQALKLVEAADSRFSLILSDHNMPDMDGTEFFESVSKISPDSRRMLMTGYKDVDIAIDAVNKGAVHHFITKPWDNDDLLLKLETELETYETSEARKAFLKTVELQNKGLYKLALSIRQADKVFKAEIAEKLKKIETLKKEIKESRRQNKYDQGVFNLHDQLSKTIVIEKETLLQAFDYCKTEVDDAMARIAEIYGLEPPKDSLSRDQLAGQIGKANAPAEAFDVIDSLLHYMGKHAEPLLFFMGIEALGSSGFHDYKTVPGFVDLGVSMGLIDPSIVADILDDMENDPSTSDDGIGTLLLKKGIVNRVNFSRIRVEQRFIETYLADQVVAEALRVDGKISEKQVQQGFIKQLNHFRETGSVMSVGELFASAGLVDPEEKRVYFDEPVDKKNEPEQGSKYHEESQKNILDLVSLQVSEDGTEAYLRIPLEIRAEINISSIQAFLETHKIRWGLVSENLISKFLKYSKDPDKKFLVALGKKPDPGQSAKIEYHFNTTYQRPGTIRADGTIDFTNRGDIPFVKDGDLLAEIVPGTESKPGVDVYGSRIDPPESENSELRVDRGASISECGSRIYATVEGQPTLDPKGYVSVHKEMIIQGDVTFKTGNIDYPGNVVVTGTIREGFSVSCIDLTTSSIQGADINVQGDLNVSEGIISSKLSVLGNVRSRYIKSSEVEVLGDVVVTREIMETRILCSGNVDNKSGRVTESLIITKQGMNMGQIGTDTAGRSTIKFGLDDHIKQLADKADTQVRKNRSKIEVIEEEKKLIEEHLFKLHKEASDQSFAHESKLRRINEMKQALAESKDKQTVKLSRMKEIKELEIGLDAFENDLKELFASQDRLMETVGTMEAKILTLNETIEKIKFDHIVLTELVMLEGPVPDVKIHTGIKTGTQVVGPNASMYIKGDVKSCRIVETGLSGSGTGLEKTLAIRDL